MRCAVLAAKLVFQDGRRSALGIVAAVQRGAVGSVGGRLGRRCSPFAVWIWLVLTRAGNNALRREEICTEIVAICEGDFPRFVRIDLLSRAQLDSQSLPDDMILPGKWFRARIRSVSQSQRSVE